MSKACYSIAQVCNSNPALKELRDDAVIVLDRIRIKPDVAVVLAYWPNRHEYVTWEEYGEGEFGTGHYFSNRISEQTGNCSGLKAAVNDLYRRAKLAGWKREKYFESVSR